VVVGAGVSGLACARRLAAAGVPVEVLERGRGVGGRTATVRVGDVPVDSGAQYMTASDPAFDALVRRLAATGLAVPWATRLQSVMGGRIADGPKDSGRVRWACPDGMVTLARQLAVGLTVERRTTVTGLTRSGDGWEVATENGPARAARAVVLAMPAPLLAGLSDAGLSGASELASRASGASYDPAWTLLAGYPRATPPTWRGVFPGDAEPRLSFLTNDSSKRPVPLTAKPGGVVLVAHASGAWSREHARADQERVRAELVEAVAGIAGRWAAEPAWARVVFWPHAQVTGVVDEPFLLTGDPAPLGACGDWCAGAKVEGAWLSGDRLGEALARRLA
jgi:predicted NAD/FAD-dependent oxidoreductase